MPAPFTFALCADDYALAPGVSRGILEALDAGTLTATSAMVTLPGWAEAATALQPHAGHADLGLHLNLTLGPPLAAMPLLAPAGTLPSIAALVRSARRGTLPLAEIAGEIERQLDGFAEAMGRPPDHVDGHQHVQVLPTVRDLLLAALRRRGWTPWLRDSADRPWRILRRGSATIKASGVAMLGHGFAAAALRAGFATNDGFAGFSSFARPGRYAAQFERYLRSPGPAHLVMCHPGYVDEVLRRLDPVLETRHAELSFMLSPRWNAVLRAAGATPARMSAMLARHESFKET